MIENLEERIELSLSYSRLSDKYRKLANDMKSELVSMNPFESDETKKRIALAYKDAVSACSELANLYSKMAEETWKSFEHEAIMENDEEAPFLNLLCAIVKEVAEDYRQCWKRIINPNTSRKERVELVRQYISLEEYFEGTSVLRILHEEQGAKAELIQRYVDSYKR